MDNTSRNRRGPPSNPSSISNPKVNGASNPFNTPDPSVKSQVYELQNLSSVSLPEKRGQYKFVSYKLKGQYNKPWSDHPRLKRTKINDYIVISFIVLGVLLSGIICFLAARRVDQRPYCLVLHDDFATIDPNIWNYDVQLDGFGTGSFDWTSMFTSLHIQRLQGAVIGSPTSGTDARVIISSPDCATDPKNAFVDKEGLHIVPTLTNETTDINNDLIYNGYTLNLTTDGSCTGNTLTACGIASNSTLGTMIPPVRSARLTTKGKKSIKYGRVEVTARLPVGDWLWPAIWMMPEESVYGVWPRSGEIDIMEARGNNYTYPAGGRDVYTTTLHWGPSSMTDAYWRTTAGRKLRRSDYSDGFHKYGLEWTENYLFFYCDSRLTQVLFVSFQTKQNFWERGEFATLGGGSQFLEDPWNQTDSKAAPFDQAFHLILNVAVGSRIGWFPDKVQNKPWLDGSTNAQWDFYSAASDWLPTWGAGVARGMTVQSVSMWQEGACA